MGGMKLLILNFNGATVEIWETMRNFIPHLVSRWLLIHAGQGYS